MSWMKRPGAEPPPQPYAPPQPYGNQPNQQNMYQTYQGNVSGTNQPPMAAQPQQQQQYWAPPTQQYNNQQYAQVYQQEYSNNANQYQQYTQNNHSVPTYQAPPQGYTQNYYQNQPQQQQNYAQPKQNKDGWEDNWDWGWDEAAKQAQMAQQQLPPAMPTPSMPPTQQQEAAFNNANVIEDSFTTSDTWNWSMEDKGEKPAMDQNASPHLPQQPPEPVKQPLDNIVHDNVSEHNTSVSNHSAPAVAEDVRTLHDKDIVKEKLPNLGLGKRFHIENLTPQWSMESQMSQDSSDGVPTHSESTYPSENQSRNSNSSPGFNVESNNYHGMDENSHHSLSSKPLDDDLTEDDNPRQRVSVGHKQILSSLKDMSISHNDHNAMDHLPNDLMKDEHHGPLQSQSVQPPHAPSASGHQFLPPPPVSSVSVANATSDLPLAAPPSYLPGQMGLPQFPPSPANLPPTSQTIPAGPANMLASPGLSAVPQGPAQPSIPQNVAHPAPPSAMNLPAPPHEYAGFPPPGSTTNPFKHGGFPSHKGSAQSPAPPGLFHPHPRSPAFGANLESAPDNSERPDLPPAPCARPEPPPPPDNQEVAPRSDRNEYLQTAHLSSSDYLENGPYARTGSASPGLRRLVVGQQGADEPPPGLSRMVPGQTTERDQPPDGRPYRRADGQQTPLAFASLARMVPGEPSNDDYAGYSAPAYAHEQRVVTGLDHEFAASDARTAAVDGADYVGFDMGDEQQRELTVEGENLQDLSAVSSADLSFAREAAPADERAPEAPEPAASERRRSSGRTSGSESGRERPFTTRAEPRRERSTRHDERRPARGDRGDERRTERGERSERSNRRRDDSGERRRRARRYDTEDTDYYSDLERERRRYREGSHSSKPPRPDELRRHRPERDSGRRYATIERERRYDDRERETASRARRSERERERDRERERERGGRSDGYRDIDPSRVHGNRERDRLRDDDRRRGEYSGSRPESRSGPTDDDTDRRRNKHRRRRDEHHYYEGYGAASDPYSWQRRQYEYYERLRRTDPAAYMVIYKQLLQQPYDRALYPHGYPGYEARTEDRASVHSGRSSANGGHNTELTTDASLNLQLEESTVRSERMTPLKFSTVHMKGTLCSQHVVVVGASYPADGRPAAVRLLPLQLALYDPRDRALRDYPGPLRHGVSHKSRVLAWCRSRAEAGTVSVDQAGYKLLWDLLALLLTHNGVVVGSDIAELIMRNARDHPHVSPQPRPPTADRHGSRRESSASGDTRSSVGADVSENGHTNSALGREMSMDSSDRSALEQYTEYLVYGNRQDALECALSRGLWGHALLLAPRAEKARVTARLLQALAPSSPLHWLYASMNAPAAPPPLESGGDWRANAAIVVANAPTVTLAPQQNAPAAADTHRRMLQQMGDSLMSRGLLYSAQFCYVISGVEFSRHPKAPLQGGVSALPSSNTPRLCLLFADPRAPTFAQLASDDAIIATEIYEYARGLTNQDFDIPEFQLYRLVLATRLADAGCAERALAAAATAASALARNPQRYSAGLRTALRGLHDRLQFFEPPMTEDPPLVSEGDSESPRHRPYSDLHALAQQTEPLPSVQPEIPLQPVAAVPLQEAAPVQESPQHQFYQPSQFSWGQDQMTQPLYQQPAEAEGVPPEETPDYYNQHVQYQNYQEEWSQEPGSTPAQPEDHAASYADPYWQNDYAQEESSPQITMPGSAPRRNAFDEYDGEQNRTQQPEQQSEAKPVKKEDGKGEEAKGGADSKGGWLGGFLTKLSLRPPNQMILPDDKNPTIVWDEERKEWRDTTSGETSARQPLPPPPSGPPGAPPALGVPPAASTPGAPAAAGPPPTLAGNIYKMQKGRQIKKSYVDVFNPTGNRPAQPAASPALFVPGPAPSGGDEHQWG